MTGTDRKPEMLDAMQSAHGDLACVATLIGLTLGDEGGTEESLATLTGAEALLSRCAARLQEAITAELERTKPHHGRHGRWADADDDADERRDLPPSPARR